MQLDPVNQLTVWWLSAPATPALVGTLHSVPGTPGAAFEYSPGWLGNSSALPLSEDLPLRPGLFAPAASDGAPGGIDDARPDRWGERLIHLIDRPARLGVLECLYCAGDHRPGALGLSLAPHRYAPIDRGHPPSIEHLAAIHLAIEAALDGASLDAGMRQLLAPGAGLGGTRPKALLDIDGSTWIVKFSAPGDLFCDPAVEHASMALARRAGINACRTQMLRHPGGLAVAVERFDRPAGRRAHVLSARTALRAAGAQLSYPAMAQLLRRMAPADSLRGELEELFRRLVFNILIDNTDDHEKNHAFYFDGHSMRLAPAYDVLPVGHALGYQSMTVGRMGSESTLSNALSCLEAYSIPPGRAVELMREVAAAVDGWQQHFLSAGVSGSDVELLSAQIDRPYLAEQRRRAIDGDYIDEAIESTHRRDAADVEVGLRDPHSQLMFGPGDLDGATFIEPTSSEYRQPGDGW